MNWIVGIAVEPAERWTLLLDYERFHYSYVNSVGNAFLPNFRQAPLGADDGAGFGWQDMSVVKGGVQFEPASDWALRAGYSYGEQPITSSEVLFNIVAPGVIEQHLSAGLSKTFARHSQVHLAVTRALPQEVTGANPLEMPDQQTIELSMNQWDVEIGYSFVP
jgi:long-chain fatty acid transport protein